MYKNTMSIKIDTQNINTPLEFVRIKAQIVNNGISYTSFKQNLKVNYQKVYFLIFLPFLFLFLSILIGHYVEITFATNILGKVITFIFVSGFIGLILHNMQNIMHAAIHYDLHPNRILNDRIANFTVGLFSACEVKQGRKIHLLHHTISGSEKDPESSYMQPLNYKKIISYFTGIEILKYILKIDKKIETNKDDKLKLTDKILYILNAHRFFSLVVHLSFLSFFYYILNSYILVFAWVYGFFAFFPFFSSVQNVMEHGEEKEKKEKNDYTLKPVNRNFSSNYFSKYIIGSYGTNKHALHHWDPSIHFLNVEQTTDFLLKSNYSESIKKYEAEYLDTFKKVFN
jgi:fatty acid desaturase